MENIKDIKTVEKIRNSYTQTEKQTTAIEELKLLDKKVKLPAKITAYTHGVVGSLVLGTGMCLAMKVIAGSLMSLGIVVGLVGIGMVSSTYSLFKFILNKRKAKYSKEIIEKSDKLLNKEGNK